MGSERDDFVGKLKWKILGCERQLQNLSLEKPTGRKMMNNTKEMMISIRGVRNHDK